MEYVRGRRLTEAAYAFASVVRDILEVALDYGYGTHEGFTRAFKAHFGKTPEEVRRDASVAGLALVDHVAELQQTYAAIWNERLPTSGKTPAALPSFERHNPTFDPRTGEGGVTIWIALEA